MVTSTIPTSNPAGNNQTSPGAVVKAGGGTTVPAAPIAPVASPTNPTAPTQQNPLVPVSAGSVVPGATTAPAGSDLITQGQDHGINALQKQYEDIYGKGVGTSMFDFLNSIGGENSAVLQEYIKSLAPEEAKAEAGLGASLGAMGVGGNSSVAALGEANLQSNIFADISRESANLTTHGEDLTASMLTGTQQAASQEVASSGWDVFGQAIGAVGNLASDVLGSKGIGGLFSKGKG